MFPYPPHVKLCACQFLRIDRHTISEAGNGLNNQQRCLSGG